MDPNQNQQQPPAPPAPSPAPPATPEPRQMSHVTSALIAVTMTAALMAILWLASGFLPGKGKPQAQQAKKTHYKAAKVAPRKKAETRINIDVTTPAGTRVKVKVDESSAANGPTGPSTNVSQYDTATPPAAPAPASSYALPAPVPQQYAPSPAPPAPAPSCEAWRRCLDDGRRTAPDMVGPPTGGASYAPTPPVGPAPMYAPAAPQPVQYAPQAPVYAPTPQASAPDQTTQFLGSVIGSALGAFGAVALNGGGGYRHGYYAGGWYAPPAGSWRPGYTAWVCEPTVVGCYWKWIP